MRHYRPAFFLALSLSAACTGAASDPSPAPSPAPPPWSPLSAPTRPEPPLEAMYLEMDGGEQKVADGLVDDMWPAKDRPAVKLAWPLTWTEDPYDDPSFRFMFYSLGYTRHLLWAYRTTRQPRYLNKLLAIVRSHVAYDANHPHDARKFDDEHATAYRAMVLTNIHVKLRREGVLPPDVAVGIRGSLERSAKFLMDPRHFEYRATSGFTEAAALLLLAHNFPDLESARGLRETGIARLEKMRTTRVDGDGVSVENSPYHHMLVLGKVSEIGEWAARYEPSMAKAWDATRRAMMRYLAYVTQPDGRLPMLGATGTTLVPNQDPRIYGWLTALDPEYAWVWSSGLGGTPPARRAELFNDAGLFVLRAPDASREQTFVTFDSGAYRTDNSQLDGLSVSLYSDSVSLFPDGGLYTYERGSDFDYFHGTRSHNTVTVDGKDQEPGPASPGAYGVIGSAAWATGQSRLYAGVTHRRTVLVLDQGLVLVTDDLESDAPHDYSQNWHIFPGANLTMAGLDANVANIKGAPIVLVRQADPGGLTVVHTRGGTSPMQGWISPALGKKEPVHALEYHRRAASTSFATLFTMGRRARSGIAPSVRQSRDPATGDRFVLVCAYGTNAMVRISDEGTVGASVAIMTGGC